VKLVFQNYELVPAIKFLEGMELKAYQSRHRTKLVNLLETAAQGLAESEYDLLKECAELDDAGEPVMSDSGSYRLREDKKTEFHRERGKLLKEEVVIEGGIHKFNIECMRKLLEEYEGVISGEGAKIYDRLLEEYEKGEQDAEDN